MLSAAGQYSSSGQRNLKLVLLLSLSLSLVMVVLLQLLSLQNLEPDCNSGTTPATKSSAAARKLLSTSTLTPAFKHIHMLGHSKHTRDQQEFTTIKRRSLARRAPRGYPPITTNNNSISRTPPP